MSTNRPDRPTIREGRAALREARAELNRISDRDRDETDAYLEANARVAAIEDSLPWIAREWP